MRMRGFTLVELLIVLAIVAVLTTLAAPSFKRQVQAARISSAVNSFMSDLRFARGEAIRRSANVIVCRSAAPEAVPPTCATGAQGTGWVSGWIVYHAGNGNGVIDPDEILRVQGPIANLDSILDERSASTTIHFTGTGRLQNLNSATSLLFGGASYNTDLQRRVCINLGGRARIAPAAAC